MPRPRWGKRRMTAARYAGEPPERAGSQDMRGRYFLAGAFSDATVPPFALQSLSDIITQPLPLQPFWPAQAFSAVWHALLPLHALTPWHCTEPSDLAETINGAAAENRPATAAAMIAPLVVICVVLSEWDPERVPRRGGAGRGGGGD